jgi:hemoglobin
MPFLGRKGVSMAEQSLYDRIGGMNALSMVVDRFSDEIVKNPKLNVNPELKEWNEKGQLPGLKFRRTLWLCETAGGPFKYMGKPMGEAHEDLHITSEEFDEVGAEIARALDHFKVPDRRSRRSWLPSSPERTR